MNLRQMKAFHAIITEGSISGAANILGLTQPAVSKLLKNLEETVGYQLFSRVKKRIIPTPEARYLFHEVDDALIQLDRLEGLFISTRRPRHESLQIGSMAGPANFLIPDILAEYSNEVANINVRLITNVSKVICERIANNTLDIGIIDVHSASPNYDYSIIPLTCLCAIPRSDKLADKPFLTPKDLDGKPLITQPRKHRINKINNDIFQKANAVYNIQHEIYYHLPAISMVRAGLGYSFIDSISAWSYEKHLNQTDIIFKPFKPMIHEDIAIITPIDHPSSELAIDIISRLKLAIIDIEQQYNQLDK